MNRTCWEPGLAAALVAVLWAGLLGDVVAADPLVGPDLSTFAEEYCFKCHGHGAAEGGLAIDELLEHPLADHSQKWESIVRKLTTRQMPPAGETRPPATENDQFLAALVERLDAAAAERPQPGRTESFRRLTRLEYQNAIRDLLSLEVDAAELLPADEAGHGFDNTTVSSLSPVLLERYISAAQKISRLAVGARADEAAETTYRIAPDVTQDAHIPGTPLGTRGGQVFRHYFPRGGEYQIHVLLMRDRNEELEGRPGKYELEVLLDRQRIALFPVERPRGADDRSMDSSLKAVFSATAGPHDLGVVFLKNQASLQESIRQPLNVHYNFYRHPRLEPAVYQVAIQGPLGKGGGEGAPAWQRLFSGAANLQSAPQSDEGLLAKQLLGGLMRRAYRREVVPADFETPLRLFGEGRAAGGFAGGMERALAAVLVNPSFLFRLERSPEGVPAGTPYRLSSSELASRLSFFLWSSLPDEELLELGIQGTLQQPDVLEAQVRRMLADEKAESLVHNFAAQWLHLRNLDSFIPDMRLYPDFDDNLRQAMRKETELCFARVVRQDLGVLELIQSDSTFLNERLARHYGIPHVVGSHFRQVKLPEHSQRGGLLRQGSILCVTSYANRTSPVLRGKWVLENLLGSPPPPPPPDVPTLDDGKVIAATLSVRERLKQHRENPTCAACHAAIDPIGFTLEHYDAIGRWREFEHDRPVDCTSVLVDGTELNGVASLEKLLLEQPEWFVQALTERLMTFGLGRSLEHYDAPAIRRIVRDSRLSNYRFSDIVLGVARSTPIQMRTAE